MTSFQYLIEKYEMVVYIVYENSKHAMTDI